MPFRRSRRCARGEWRRLGARKASPRVGPPTKAGGARRTPLFACAACANQRLAISTPRLHTLLVGAVSTANDPPPSAHLKTRPGQSFTPTEPLAPIPTNPAQNAGPSLPADQPHLDASTATQYLWERSRPRTTLGPPPIEKPDLVNPSRQPSPWPPSRQTQRRTLTHRCSPISPTLSRCVD